MGQEARAKAFRQSGFSRMALRDVRGRFRYRQAIELYEQLVPGTPNRSISGPG